VSRADARLRSTTLFLVSAFAVILVGGLAALATWLFHEHTRPACTVNCPPPRSQGIAATGLPEAETFTSPKLGWVLAYPKAWKVEDTSGDNVLFQTRAGLLKVEAAKTTTDLGTLLDRARAAVDNAELPDLESVGTLRGAHLGSQQAEGRLYQATFYPPSGGGRGLLVRIGIVAATRDGVTVVCTAIAPYDQHSGRMAAEDIDYAFTEFRWPGE